MHKIKNVFQRSQKLKTEERRPQQFVKRHTSLKNAAIIETPVPDIPAPPSIDLAELSEMERPMYESWWKDLDPFNLQTINNETVLKFLNGCALEDNKLEQILALFDSVKDGLNKYQFFAMLRLIAHAQNGRKISRALIYLGAPVPHFNTNAIDAIIKTIPENDSTAVRPDRKSWWGYEKQPQLENRRSYMGPFTAHTPIPNTTTTTPLYNNDNNLMDYFYNNNDALTPSWSNSRPALTNSITTPAAIIPVTPNNKSAEEKQQLTHSRSRSAGTATDIINTTNPYHTTTTATTEEEIPQLQSSRSSLSLNELNTGSSLLLTQKFVYQSPSVRNRELNVNNPFNIPSYEDLQLEKHKDIKSPFDDENSQEEEDSYPNNKPNAQNILPPPVPNQSTKPAFPKYTRTNTFLIKRSQSTAADKRPSHLKHSRHKSTSATENVFY